MAGFMTAALVAGGLGLAGSVYGANKAADAAEESRELPEWMRPYVLGDGSVPEYMQERPKINTQWIDYIKRLGEGGYDAPWAPMTADSPWFNQDQTFTPEPGGGPYGSLPSTKQPPVQQGGGMDLDAFTQFAERMARQNQISGMEDVPWDSGKRYSRDFRDMSRSEFNGMDKLYQLMRG